jgi:hypothetical protein
MRCIPGIPERRRSLRERAGRILDGPLALAVVAPAVVVALPIDTPAEARLVEEALVDTAEPPELELRLVVVDLSREIRRDAALQAFFPLRLRNGTEAHEWLLSR